MLHHPDDVLIDLDGRCVCPVHGPQAGEYAPGVAPCGCRWVAGAHIGGALRRAAAATSGRNVAENSQFYPASVGLAPQSQLSVS